MKLDLLRLKETKTRTLGILMLIDDDDALIRTFFTLELPWRNNEKNVSCIPEGVYTINPRKSDKYGKHFIINNVPNRSYILLHHGNYSSDTSGCILVGTEFKNLDNEKELEVANSKKAMETLTTMIGERYNVPLRIRKGF